MPETKNISLRNLLLDLQNPRLVSEVSSQQDALRAIVEEDVSEFLTLAKHVATHGKDPGDLPIVIPAEKPGKYVALDGNRRLAVLKALSKPDLVKGVLSAPARASLKKAAEEYKQRASTRLMCVVEKDRNAADPWLLLRHGGELGGAGRVPWDSPQKDRYRELMGAHKPFYAQALDLAVKVGGLSEVERGDVPTTTFDRILKSPEARTLVGLALHNKVLHVRAPESQVASALAHIAKDLARGTIKVGDVYKKADQVKYLKGLASGVLPRKVSPIGESKPASTTQIVRPRTAARTETDASRSTSARSQEPRAALIPKECSLNVTDGRLRDIELELRKLRMNDHPNAVSVLFRVFVELSLDEYITREKLSSAKEGDTLGHKMKAVAHDLEGKGKLTKKEREVVAQAATKGAFLMPSVDLMHGYIHNPKFFPVPSDLRNAWSSIQPFMVACWQG